MASQASGAPAGADRQWFIVGRWQEYEGEARANLLRIIAVGLFYVVELASYYGLRLGVFEMPKEVDLPFHQAVTSIAVAWTALSLGVLLCLHERFFPSVLKYLTTGCDVALLTGVLVVASGPKSPLVAGYFLLIALATLRFSLPLVRFTTVASMLGYLVVLGHARWYRSEEFHIPRYHQVMLLLALALCGVVLGQVIRRVAGLAREYAARLEAARAEVPPKGHSPAGGESP
jgi:hypothetical protein